MVERHDNWPMMLSAYLTERLAMPFAWGSNDCLTFAAGLVERLTGYDFAAQYPAYSNPVQANAIMTEHGGVEAIITACLGEPVDKYRMARRGDIVLIMMPEPSAGVVDDSGQRIAAIGATGMVRLPLSKAHLVWRY